MWIEVERMLILVQMMLAELPSSLRVQGDQIVAIGGREIREDPPAMVQQTLTLSSEL